MRTRQYAYFAIRSETVTAVEIAARLGVEPDRASVRGSKATTPRLRPATHAYELHAKVPAGEQFDVGVAALIARLRPLAEPLAALAREGHAGVLQLVRTFDADDADSPAEDTLGWHLDAAALAFLASIGAALDVDEYA